MSDVPVPPPPTPAVPAVPAQPPRERDLLTAGMLEALKATKPWVRFLGILGYIASAFILLAGIAVIGIGLLQGGGGSGGGLLFAGLGVVYLLMGVLYIFPARFLNGYASAIEEALGARYKSAAVERALRQQKSFWRFVGILTVVMLVLYIPGVLAAIAIPNLLTAMQTSKVKRSVADLRSIATSLEAYAVDHNQYPNVKSFAELAPLLEPKYAKPLPRVDGWGNSFVYEPARCEPACSAYYLASGGKDGKLDRALPDYGSEYQATVGFNEDLVFANGQFLRGPEGSN